MDCHHCQGSGIDPDDKEEAAACPECEGTGWIEDEEEETDDDD